MGINMNDSSQILQLFIFVSTMVPFIHLPFELLVILIVNIGRPKWSSRTSVKDKLC